MESPNLSWDWKVALRRKTEGNTWMGNIGITFFTDKTSISQANQKKKNHHKYTIYEVPVSGDMSNKHFINTASFHLPAALKITWHW